MTRPLRDFLLALALLACAPISLASADGLVKVRLFSPSGVNDVEGDAMLQGQNLSGHIVGNGADFVLTGQVKRRAVSVELVGRIMPSCNLNRQSMNGIGENDHESTSIEMTFECSSKAGGFGGGQEYQFRLYLVLPPPVLYSPSQSGIGENASLE